MAQTLIAIAFGKVTTAEGLLQSLDWSLINLHLQHLNWTMAAAMASPGGNETALSWFLKNFASVSLFPPDRFIC